MPNRAARTLVTRRTDTVALVVSESEQRVFDEPFFAGTIRGIGSALAETGLQLILAMAQSPRGARAAGALPDQPARRRRAADVAARRRPAAGAAGGDGRADRARRQARRPRPPTATSTWTTGPAPGRRSSTCWASAAGGSPPSPARRTWAWASTGWPATATRCCATGLPRAGGLRRLHRGERRRRRCASCWPRTPASTRCSPPPTRWRWARCGCSRPAGRAIPEDVAVIGFDDSKAALHADPPLTTVHQPTEAMGRQMARLLVGPHPRRGAAPAGR